MQLFWVCASTTTDIIIPECGTSSGCIFYVADSGFVTLTCSPFLWLSNNNCAPGANGAAYPFVGRCGCDPSFSLDWSVTE